MGCAAKVVGSEAWSIVVVVVDSGVVAAGILMPTAGRGLQRLLLFQHLGIYLFSDMKGVFFLIAV